MKKILFVLLLAGCDPFAEPELKCDYCHVMREGAKRYLCDKCKSVHVACKVEQAILHYDEKSGLRGAIYYSATSVLTCPLERAAADVKEGPELLPMKPEKAPLKERISNGEFFLFLFGILVFCAIFYSKGRFDANEKLRNR